MKTLITGATGFVGAAVLRQLLDRGHDVRALVRKTSDLRNLKGLEVETCTGDLNDTESLNLALQGCNALFHIAADYRIWAPNPDEMVRNNLSGSKNLMTAALAAGIERIVYTSSVATLGLLPGGAPADEATLSSLETMVGAYKRSKFLAEQEVQRLINEENLPAIIVNPSAPIGPRDIKPTPTGRMVLQAAKGAMPAYVETGLNVVHVDDVAAGHILAYEKGEIGERYILGGENMTLKKILILIAEITGGRPPKFSIPHNAILPFAYLAETWANISGGKEPFATVDGINMAKKKMFFKSGKARDKLGFTSRPAGQAFADAIKWFEENGYLN